MRAIFVLLVLTVYVNQALACSNFFSDKRGGFPPTYVPEYNGGISVVKTSGIDLFQLSEESLLKLCKLVDQKLIRALEKKGFEVRIATPGSDTLAYLDFRNVRALTFAGDEKLIFIRQNATKSELLEEFLHNTQFKLKMNERVSLQELEVHVKHFMKNHAEILGINNKYNLEFIERLIKMEQELLPRSKP